MKKNLITFLIFLGFTLINAQEKKSEFELKSDLTQFLTSVHYNNKTYLLASTVDARINQYIWKVFDENHQDTGISVPMKLTDEQSKIFSKATIFHIIDSDSAEKTVFLLTIEGKTVTAHTGTINTQNLTSGVQNFSQTYSFDMNDMMYKMRRVFLHNDKFHLLVQGKVGKVEYFVLNPQEFNQTSFQFTDKNIFEKLSNNLQALSLIGEGKDKFFANPKSIYLNDDYALAIFPREYNVNKGYRSMIPIQVVYMDLIQGKVKTNEIDIPDGKTVDFGIVNEQLYLSCLTKENVTLYSYDFKNLDLKEIHAFNDANAQNYSFKTKKFYMNNERNEILESNYKDWKSETNKTMVLGLADLGNNQIEITVSGARYRDPDGFAKAMVIIASGAIGGALGGAGSYFVFPNFQYANLQPLLTTTSLAYNSQTNAVEILPDAVKADATDKFFYNNGFFKGKSIVGDLKEDILIIDGDEKGSYDIYDFCQPMKSLIN